MFCRIFLLSSIGLAMLSDAHADKVIWSGEVHSNGKPTEAIHLTNHKKYQIKANGFVNLGKWIKKSEPLANDSCYEFGKSGSVEKLESLKNSNEISVCDGKYHPDHAYQSEPFVAKQNLIHFWIHDTDYSDNADVFQVQIVEIE